MNGSCSLRRAFATAARAAVRKTAETRIGRLVWRRLKRWVEGDHIADLDHRLFLMHERTPPEEWKMLKQAWDDTTPLPPGAEAELSASNPRLIELRSLYVDRNLTIGLPWQWNAKRLGAELNLCYFRGESPYVWQYRDLPRVAKLKFYVAAQYLRSRDPTGLLDRLGEDGAFGSWTYVYSGSGRISRDLLDSVNELLFLDRHLKILQHHDLRVLDIGAGYGRLAYRMVQAVAGLADYCCVDAVAESTFLSEYYLQYRRAMPPARVLPLYELDAALCGARFDLVVNVHSFSECTHAAITSWCEQIARLRAPYLFIVPNDSTMFLSTETDGSKRDFLPLIQGAGYELMHMEPVYDDTAVRELMGVTDHFCLFKLRVP